MPFTVEDIGTFARLGVLVEQGYDIRYTEPERGFHVFTIAKPDGTAAVSSCWRWPDDAPETAVSDEGVEYVIEQPHTEEERETAARIAARIRARQDGALVDVVYPSPATPPHERDYSTPKIGLTPPMEETQDETLVGDGR